MFAISVKTSMSKISCWARGGGVGWGGRNTALIQE